MKRSIRIILPVVLAIAIVVCSAWYLFIYDRGFTRDMLLKCARYSESQGNHTVATWFYTRAYTQSGNSDAVAIELAQQYVSDGNFTKAEFTLTNAIENGGGIDVYIALCNTYVLQDKLLDAVTMLNNVTNTQIKEELETLRPETPAVSPEPGFFTQYISVTLESDSPTIYASNDGNFPSTASQPYSEPIPLAGGENIIYSIAVGENGLVSPVGINQYTIGGVIEKVSFADAAVEAEVRTLLNVGEDKELFTDDLWTITEFTVPEGAQSYGDLKHMIYLEALTIENGVSGQIEFLSGMSKLSRLTISNTELSQDDLKIIGALPLLKELTIRSTGISGIAPLGAAIQLEKLDASENTIRNLDALKNLPQLQIMDLSGNAITEISALASCTALTQLDISSNNITTLAPITALTGLTEINAANNQITDLSELGKLTGLKTLNLSTNTLSAIDTLSGCANLTELDISTNSLTDISALSGINSLMRLNFSHNQVTKLPEFSESSALVTIDGSYNQLTSLTSLGGLQQLNEVHMDYNAEISSVSELATCPVLIRVNVYATKVTDVKDLTDQSIEVNYNPVQ